MNKPWLPPVNPFDLIKQANELMRQAGAEVYDPEQRWYDAMLAKAPAENDQRYRKIAVAIVLKFEEVKKMFLDCVELHEVFSNDELLIKHLNECKTILWEDVFLKVCSFLPKWLLWRPENFKKYFDEVQTVKWDLFEYFSGNRKKYFWMTLKAIDALEGYQETV